MLLRASEVLAEPGRGAIDYVPAVFGTREQMTFVGIDDEFGGHFQRLEGVPEFVGLRGGAFAVAIAYEMSVGVFAFLMKLIGELLA